MHTAGLARLAYEPVPASETVIDRVDARLTASVDITIRCTPHRD